jgi:hypothetical protein
MALRTDLSCHGKTAFRIDAFVGAQRLAGHRNDQNG